MIDVSQLSALPLSYKAGMSAPIGFEPTTSRFQVDETRVYGSSLCHDNDAKAQVRHIRTPTSGCVQAMEWRGKSPCRGEDCNTGREGLVAEVGLEPTAFGT